MPSRSLDGPDAGPPMGRLQRQDWPGSDRIHILPDGRRVGYREYGDAGGISVMALHGTPGSRQKFAIAHDEACALGLRLICPDRWGYGLTDAPARPSLARYPDDIAHLASALGIARFGVVGISGGGPYAAAIATRLPQSVIATALVAPVGQMSTPDERIGVSVFHRFCFRVLPRLPGGTTGVFTVFKGMLAIRPRAAMKAAAARACASDRAALAEPAVQLRLAETFRLGLSPGVRGPVIDMRLFSVAWGLDFTKALAPARLWIGTADRNVPVSAARRLIDAFPSAETTILQHAGHFWITRHYGDVLAWLSGRMLEELPEGKLDGRADVGAQEHGAQRGARGSSLIPAGR